MSEDASVDMQDISSIDLFGRVMEDYEVEDEDDDEDDEDDEEDDEEDDDEEEEEGKLTIDLNTSANPAM